MKAIVTKQNPDGSFDECGMNNRAVIGPYVREAFVVRRCMEWADGRPCRIELYRNESLFGEPFAMRFYGCTPQATIGSK